MSVLRSVSGAYLAAADLSSTQLDHTDLKGPFLREPTSEKPKTPTSS
jgi:hypothetical protein